MVAIKSQAALVAFTVLALTGDAFARFRWMERDGKSLYRRRFGQERPAVIDKLSQACPGQVCGTLSGEAITPLLAAQPECSQQDMADKIIDAAAQFDEPTRTNMINLAIEYRQAEKNTPPDFSTNPPTNRNSVFCQKAPKNAQLNGLVQAQDPANDPNVFFDPNGAKSVQKGSQANTAPFGGAAAAPPAAPPAAADPNAGADCPPDVTVTVTADQPAATAAPPAAQPPANNAGNNNAGAGGIGNFGSCTVPQIEFGAGFENRRETSFQPVDKQSFNHGSAQNIDIITQFICDTLTNSCKADATAKATCQTARAAASAAAVKTGAQADAFNGVFGIQTQFANVQVIDNQGRPVGTPAGGNNAAAPPAAAPPAAAPPAAAPPAAAPPAAAPAAGNLQKFAGALGGVTAPTVTDIGGGKFQVEGNAQFNALRNALVRSCDVQNNKCANAANASGNKNGLTVQACNAQQATCIAQAGN